MDDPRARRASKDPSRDEALKTIVRHKRQSVDYYQRRSSKAELSGDEAETPVEKKEKDLRSSILKSLQPACGRYP